MSKCSVCDKPVADGASECSMSCLMQAQQKGQGQVSKARQGFNSSINKMMEPKEARPQQEVSMIKVKHRSMRNRNVVADSVVLSYDHEGIAFVPFMGNNKDIVEFYVRQSKGLAEIVNEEEQKPAPSSVIIPPTTKKVDDTVKVESTPPAPKNFDDTAKVESVPQKEESKKLEVIKKEVAEPVEKDQPETKTRIPVKRPVKRK